tara:strand:- start:155 stop:562 length:408 start_codon:yes stop_codon:yes gene_type:complete
VAVSVLNSIFNEWSTPVNKHNSTISQLLVLLLLAVYLPATMVGCGYAKKVSLNGAAFSDILVAEFAEFTESIAEPPSRSSGKPGLRDTGAALSLADIQIKVIRTVSSGFSGFSQRPDIQYEPGAKPARAPPLYTI